MLSIAITKQVCMGGGKKKGYMVVLVIFPGYALPAKELLSQVVLHFIASKDSTTLYLSTYS